MSDRPSPTAEKIKTAALSLFLNAGYDGTSLSDIAKAVGIKTPSIYAHFESKDRLFLQLFADVIDEDLAKFKSLMHERRDVPPVEQLRGAFDYYADNDAISAGQTFLRQTFLMPPGHLRGQLREHFLRYEEETTNIILTFYGRGIREGHFRPGTEEQLIALFYAGADGLLVERHMYEEALLRSRKENVWLSLLQLVAADSRKGQRE